MNAQKRRFKEFLGQARNYSSLQDLTIDFNAWCTKRETLMDRLQEAEDTDITVPINSLLNWGSHSGNLHKPCINKHVMRKWAEEFGITFKVPEKTMAKRKLKILKEAYKHKLSKLN